MQTRHSLSLEFYKKLFLVRQVGLTIQSEYHLDEMKTPIHLSMGGEHIGVGVCQALGDNNPIFSSYRSHAIYLAKTGETDRFFAELYGKVTGVAKGKAGSMHLSSFETGFFGASAIVGSVLPVAVGAAYANRRKHGDKVACVFFGDGALDEGNFWESLNMACLMKLPLLMVCEDNNYAVHINKKRRNGYNSIADVVRQFYCNVLESDSTDVETIYQITQEAIVQTKEKHRPSFLVCHYYRYLEHVGVNEDFNAGYRHREEMEPWLLKDPVDLQRRRLLEQGISKQEIQNLEKGVEDQISASLQKAKEDPYPSPSELYQDVFA